MITCPMQLHRAGFRIFGEMIKMLIYLIFLGFPLIISAQYTFQVIIEKNDSTSPSSPTHSITETANGDIYAMSTISPGGWYKKIRLVKLNPNGIIIWDTTYSHTSEHEFFPEIMPAHDGGVVIACTSFSYPLHDNDTVSDILIWKINDQAVIEWHQILPAREFYDMTVTKDGGYLFLGSIHEKPFNQGLDIIVYKTHADGSVIWSRQLGQNTSEFPYEREYPQSIKTIDGQIYVCGFHVHDGWSENDGVMYTLDSNGNLLWDIFIPDSLDEDNVRVNSVFKFDDRFFFKITGGYLCEFRTQTGEHWNTSFQTNFNSVSKGYNYEILCGIDEIVNITLGTICIFSKFNNISDPYYQKVIPEISGSFVEMIASKDGGYLVLTGDGSNMQITKTDCLGNIDFWSDECNSKIPEDKQLLVYPNPSEHELRIEATFDFNEVVIFSTSGQYASYNNPCSCPRQTLDISELAAGVYFVRISSDENFAVSRFVKI